MSEFASFDELKQQVFTYFDNPETLQRAYKLLEDAFPRYPEHAGLIYNWQFCAAALMEKSELALAIIQKSLDAGYWWNEDYFRNDPDLASLQDLPEFNRLVKDSVALHQAAQANAKPFLLTLPPPVSKKDSLPLLMALHGNTVNAQYSVKDWEGAVNLGWLTVLPQSSQLYGPEMFLWDDLEWGAREIEKHYQELSGNYKLDPNHVVIGGFSKGGEMAIWFTLKEFIPLTGFIAVNPGGPLIQHVENWLPILDKCKKLSSSCGFFVAGEQDSNAANIKALYELLMSRGMTCEYVVKPGLAHDIPDDFNQVLAKALEFFQRR